MDGYQEDLAYIHDRGFSDLALAASRMVKELVPAGHVVDLGCGGGEFAEQLVRAKYKVTGIDLSPAMVALAKRRVSGAQFHVASAYDYEIPGCDAVTAIGEVLSYGFEETGMEQLRTLFSRVHRALAGGGVFLFDIATKGRAPEPTTAHRKGRDWEVTATAHEDGDTLVRSITSRRKIGSQWRQSKEIHHLRLHEPNVVGELLESAGFVVEQLGGYDDYGFQPGWDAFLALKNAGG